MDRFNQLINSRQPVLVDFFAEWCGPYKTMAPILKEVKATMGSQATIVKVDVDKNQATVAAYKVNSVPTLMIFRNGKILWKQSGVVPASDLLLLLESHMH